MPQDSTPAESVSDHAPAAGDQVRTAFSGSDVGPEPARERYRRRLGLSQMQWTLGVSLLLALPYLGFLYAVATGLANGLWFVLATTAYSAVAIYANYRL